MVLISLAGPFAGFAVAGALYAMTRYAPVVFYRLPVLVQFGVASMIEVNLVWGVINLAPVLPFDGGHVLEHTLGPKRIRLTAAISFLVGMGLALFFAVTLQAYWTAMIFALGAMRSYQRFAAVPEPIQPARRAAPAEEEVPGEIKARLISARAALEAEHLDRAIAIAQEVIAGGAPKRGAREAFEIIAWAHLLDGRTEAADAALGEARKRGEPDAALIGALLFARKELREARRVFEAARATGDDRKEIVGPLIQILIEQGEVARAAATAFDIVESLSAEDTRQMAKIAFEGGAFDWSARLSEVAFAREAQAEDAYAAARAHASSDHPDRALQWLQRAVEAGFSDRARAWSDQALEKLRASGAVEAVVPRP
jgi:hypothetical protein